MVIVYLTIHFDKKFIAAVDYIKSVIKLKKI